MKQPNRKMRRRQRDVDAGLVFAWRVPGGSLGRLVFGVLVASGLFAGAASMVRIKGPTPREESREAARIVVLRADDPASRELLDWARFHSPFPDRWEPTGHGHLEARMRDLTEELEEAGQYQARLRPRVVDPARSTLPGLMDLAARMIPPSRAGADGPRLVAVDVPVEAVSVASDGLQERWGRRTADWEGDDAQSLMGRQARFMVGVTPDGEVSTCLLIDGVGEDTDLILENWLRRQVLLAEEGVSADLTWGMVRIQIQAKPEEEGEADD